MSTAAAKTVRLIARNNAAVARAAGVALTAEGVAIAAVRRPALMTLSVLLGAFAVLTLCKVTMIAILGDAGYAAGLATLAQGSVVDQATAWVMQADAATLTMAARLI